MCSLTALLLQDTIKTFDIIIIALKLELSIVTIMRVVSIRCLVLGKSAVNQTSSVKYSILLTDETGTRKAEDWEQPGLAFFESVCVSNYKLF